MTQNFQQRFPFFLSQSMKSWKKDTHPAGSSRGSHPWLPGRVGLETRFSPFHDGGVLNPADRWRPRRALFKSNRCHKKSMWKHHDPQESPGLLGKKI